MVAISIIVTSYSADRLDDIRGLLQSIRRQIALNYEVVYVTERDRRLQRTVAEEIRGLGLTANVIHNEGNKGLAEARNLGASVASGDILGFVDDDVTLDPGWSRVVEETFRACPNVAGMTGPAYPDWDGRPAVWLPFEFDWLIGCTRWFKSKVMVEVRNCWGMNMCFRKSVFERCGGFSPSTGYHRGEMAEDVEFSIRVRKTTGEKILYNPLMKVGSRVHPYRLSDRFIIERSWWIGKSRKCIKRSESVSPGVRSYEDGVLSSILGELPTVLFSPGLDYKGYIKRWKLIVLSALSLSIAHYLA